MSLALEHPLDETVSVTPIRFAVIDLETTGLDPLTSRIVELAVVELDEQGRRCDEFTSLIAVPGEEDLGARAIHGISRAILKDAPTFAALLPALIDRLAGRVLVGHVIAFDLAHLFVESSRARYRLPQLEAASVCTRALATRAILDGSRSLAACCRRLGVETPNPHSALGDARATAELLAGLLDWLEPGELAACAQAAQRLKWPARPSAPAALKPRLARRWW